MNTKIATLKVAPDGTLTIPGDIIQELELSPDQTVTIERREDTLILIPPREARLKRIGDLLRTALADVEWSTVESGRRDRCF